MRKEYKIILAILIVTLGLMWLKVPLEVIFDQYFNNNMKDELLAKIIDRILIFVVLLIAVKKLGLSTFNGFSRNIYIRDKFVLVVPVFLIAAGIWGSWAIFTNADTELFILFTFSVLLVGLVEETCMRGLILPLLINSQNGWKYSLYYGVIVSALIFGLIHYLNLFHQPDNFWGITSQVFFGTSIGMVFGALMLRTGNLFIVALCHAFVNLILGNRILREETVTEIVNHPQVGNYPVISLIGTAVLFGIIALIGLNMIRRVNKTEVEADLQSLKI